MKKLGLLVMPLMAVSFLASCETSKPKYTLTLTLNNCTVDGESTYFHTYVEGERIEDVVIIPNDNYALTDESVSEEYRENWEKGTGDSYVLSGLVMNKNYTIEINPSNAYDLILVLNNCTVDGESTYSRTYIEGETIEPIIVTPDDNYTLLDNSIDAPYQSYWHESQSEPGSYELSGLKMSTNHTIVIVPSNVYALTLILKNCTVDGESIYSRTYIEGETIESVSVTPDDTCFLDGNSVDEQYKDNWTKGEGDSYVLSNLTMNSNHIINVSALHNYQVSIGKVERLLFKTRGSGEDITTETAIEGKEFGFLMYADNSLINSVRYKVPAELDIYIGDSEVPLAPDKYSFSYIGDEEASIIIHGENVTGNIKLSGSAIQVDYYKINAKCYGVNSDIDPSSPYALSNEDKIITFSQLEEYKLPNNENIYISFENSYDWKHPNDESLSSYCEYNENTGQLIINANMVNNNVLIRVRSSDYPLLDKLSWKQISDYSIAGYAPYVFYCGEEKTVKVNGLNHQVRIIGFNHDDLVDSGKAGITFEFVNLITNSNGSAVTTHWNDKDGNRSNNFNFPESNLNDLLNNNSDCIFTKLPITLKDTIKEVNKKVGLGMSYSIDTPYQTKLFPLAYYEITGEHNDYVTEGEGTLYQYYQEHTSPDDKIKKKVNGDSGLMYWTRSPGTGRNNVAWIVDDIGHLFYYFTAIHSNKFTTAPAFCI